MESWLSRRISALRFLLVAGLVYVHFGPLPHSASNPFRGVADLSNLVPEMANSLVLYLFFSAVPLLSLISGYLFFLGDRPLLDKLRRRVHTLLLPSLLWLTLWLLVGWALAGLLPAAVQSLNVAKDPGAIVTALTGFQWPEHPLPSGVRSLYRWLNDATGQPVALQFWFIHDLVLTLLATPILAWLLKRHALVTLGFLAMVWLSGYEPPLMFNANVLFFFSIGAAVALNGWRGPIPGSTLFWCSGLVAMLLTRVLVPAWTQPVGTMPFEHWLECGIRLFGTVTMLRLVWASPGVVHRIQPLAPAAFFLFASHYPTVVLLKHLVAPWVSGPMGQLLTWLLMPLLSITLLVGFAWFLARFTPRVFALLNGQRGWPGAAGGASPENQDATSSPPGSAERHPLLRRLRGKLERWYLFYVRDLRFCFGGLHFQVLVENDRRFNFAYFQWLKENRPQLYRHLRFTVVGGIFSRPRRGSALLLPWLQDPVKERSLALYRRVRRIERWYERRGLPVINSVRSLSNTKKSEATLLARELGLLAARFVPCPPSCGFDRLTDELGLPFILRDNAAHRCRMHLITDRESFDRIDRMPFIEPVACEFIDTAQHGWFHKFRCVLIGDKSYPRHLVISRHWCVHTAERSFDEHHLALERDYLLKEQGAQFQRLQLLRQRMGLDWVAFDYSLTIAGELVMWEPNPFPVLWHYDAPLPDVLDHQRQANDKIFEALTEYCLERAKVTLDDDESLVPISA
ncbi:acyltransferase family protein [Ferrimonas gelatinilytica]|uniref:Acyltransferase 3 domain-containing protein n=1 Tax=Ferrimonas gelatinilytica TaxID=1255257 RepID=A0ABP9RUQ5_9GAMM